MLCQDEVGNTEEVVVKLRAGIETHEMGSISEAIASLFAQDLDLPVPEPRLVQIEAGLEAGISDQEFARRVQQSIGWNFGSKKLGPGFTTWPKNKPIPLLLRPLAAEILAFDSIVQNPDRRTGNPNVLWKGDEMYIYDHEMSLTFFLPQIGWQPPWTGEGLEFLRDHVFYQGLQSTDINLDRLTGALEAVTDKRLSEYLTAIPDEWKATSDAAGKATAYLAEVRQNSEAVVNAVRRILK